jgi:excisionase family DNA binding protein
VSESVAIVRTGYLTRAELAAHLGVSEKTIARWDTAGMPSERWGRRLLRYRLDRVERWLERKAA